MAEDDGIVVRAGGNPPPTENGRARVSTAKAADPDHRRRRTAGATRRIPPIRALDHAPYWTDREALQRAEARLVLSDAPLYTIGFPVLALRGPEPLASHLPDTLLV